MNLSDVIIVLARPSEPGNSGAVCRAMKNFGLSRLRLASPNYCASPEANPANRDERGLPAGTELERLFTRAVHAEEIWNNAEHFENLGGALADCAITVGTTRRRGKRRKRVTMNPRELAEFLRDKTGTAAIVFGNERTGLEDAELELCNIASHIPVAPEFPSLNLSHAVQTYAYELFQSMGDNKSVSGQWVPMTQSESAALAKKISASLEGLGFYKHPGREEQERFLRDLFVRAGLTLNEGRYLGNVVEKAARLASK